MNFSELYTLAIEPKSWSANILLPVGISFFTFQTMSYTIDVYRQKLKPTGFLNFIFYVSFFPQLVAGPIVRAIDFLPQILPKKFSQIDWSFSVRLIIIGLIKKMILSDYAAMVSDAVFAAPENYSTVGVWIGVLSYTIQIFCDFSGYSDMAIGFAGLLGYRLRVNFNLPYISKNIAEFWQRWHISLSSWLRDYLYIPLGGNRRGSLKTYRNLAIVMLLGGLWHGASWNFVFWGGLHGLGLAAHRLFRYSIAAKIERIIPTALHPLKAFGSWIATLGFVMICWVFFRSTDFKTSLLILNKMFFYTAEGQLDLPYSLQFVLGIVILSHIFGILRENVKGMLDVKIPRTVEAGIFGLLFFLILLLAPDGTRPFIYFQF